MKNYVKQLSTLFSLFLFIFFIALSTSCGDDNNDNNDKGENENSDSDLCSLLEKQMDWGDDMMELIEEYGSEEGIRESKRGRREMKEIEEKGEDIVDDLEDAAEEEGIQINWNRPTKRSL